MLIADQKDYKTGYKKHLETYKKLKTSNSDIKSRRLLLCYLVECGFKYMLLNIRKKSQTLSRFIRAIDP